MLALHIFRKQNVGYFLTAIVAGVLMLSACKDRTTRHPALSLLPQANSIYIQIDCKDSEATNIAHYFLQRDVNNFSGQAQLAVTPVQHYDCSHFVVEKVAIPEKTAQDFLEMLSKSMLGEGNVAGLADSGACPSIKMEIGLETGPVVFYTASQDANKAPWGVVIDGKTYSADPSVPAQALATLDSYLKTKAAGDLAGKPGTGEGVALESPAESSAETIALLIGALRDRDEFVRNCAAKALGEQKDERAFVPLSKLLSDRDEGVRKAAVQAMSLVMAGAPASGVEKQAVVPLIGVLKDKDKNVRETAAELLGGMKDDRAVDPLIQAMSDTDGEVRKSAAAALGVLKDKRAVEPLITALNDEDMYVRRQAASAFWKMPEEGAVKPLINSLADADGVVVGKASIALGRIGDTQAVEPLIRTLKNKDKHIRQNAATALGLLKDKRAVNPLISALKDKDLGVRMAAASALGKIKDNLAINPLEKALKDTGIYVRRNAAVALGMLGDKQAVRPLIGALKDTDKEVRKAAASALGMIQDERAVEPLIDVSKNDVDEGVQRAAVLALTKMKKSPEKK